MDAKLLPIILLMKDALVIHNILELAMQKLIGKATKTRFLMEQIAPRAIVMEQMEARAIVPAMRSVSKANCGRRSNLCLIHHQHGTVQLTTCKEQRPLVLGWMILLNGPCLFQMMITTGSCSHQETLQSGFKL